MSEPELELTVTAYDKLIEMMRSSNMEDFFMGLELYKNHKRTHVLDVLMAKSFGGTKRVKLIIELQLSDVPMLVTIDMVEPLIKTNNERLIFERLKDEYNNY
jgi:hypothetical protein